ncbi:hypothetical protein Geob_3312 [Geotalea daltonii FRC-32]|uniref:Lipoprotein n=1 Tax=Geotalea daltonii (strain DSM 22248 / JCM 15807 / FRC-32) TaxID=316067 RepID=B9M4X1_GEODF|nr:hypothetical protein [Geotalea daltonii]ACM21655.1 hypothetical protein Geob_3312 [Geotalea daltonii FRC-32]
MFFIKQWIMVLIVGLTLLAGCDEEGWSPADHEVLTKFQMGYSGGVGAHKGNGYSFDLCLMSFADPLSNVNIKVSLPPELKLVDGDLRWKGNMPTYAKQCLTLHVRSTTEWKDWSTPINMHSEFLYKGNNVVGNYNVSYDDTQKNRNEAVWTMNGKQIRND